MDHRIYLVIMTSLDEGYLGIHAGGSSPTASDRAWSLLHDETMLVEMLFDPGVVEEPEPGIRQICLGIDRKGRYSALTQAACPHPRWVDLHPAADFEALSRGETPAYIKRWLAFEPWAE